MNADPIVFVAAKRTPQGRLLGALAGYDALGLALVAARAALGALPLEVVDQTITGNCLPPLLNVSRQLSLSLGIPQSAPAYTLNMACASGMKAIHAGADALRLGHAEVVLCGGCESMTAAPHLLPKARTGFRLGDARLIDSMLVGLSDPILGESMAQTAQRQASRHRLSREAQDQFAYGSHRKAIAAQQAGVFAAELAPLPELERDEHPRADTTPERLAKLRPTLGPESSITAGNASGINDGAAFVVLCRESTARRYGWEPLARLGAYVSTGCDPAVMGEGPVHAIRRLLEGSGTSLGDYDAIEINEAFAAQTLACLCQLGIDPADPRLNPHGGAIALGHPIGASGARLVVHLVHQVAQGKIRRGLASLCVGGGMGIASVIEAIQ